MGRTNLSAERLPPSLASPDQPSQQQPSGHRGQDPSEMFFRHRTHQMDNLWAEFDGQDRESEEADEAPLEGRRGQHEQLERGWRRQHRGEHDRPEFVALERSMDLREPFFGNALAQESFSAKISDGVNHKTTERGAGR